MGTQQTAGLQTNQAECRQKKRFWEPRTKPGATKGKYIDARLTTEVPEMWTALVEEELKRKMEATKIHDTGGGSSVFRTPLGTLAPYFTPPHASLEPQRLERGQFPWGEERDYHLHV